MEDLIREKIGDDAGRRFRSRIDELIAAVDDVETELDNTEIRFEIEEDGYLGVCRKSLNSFCTILVMLDEPRLNREALQAVAKEARDELFADL